LKQVEAKPARHGAVERVFQAISFVVACPKSAAGSRVRSIESIAKNLMASLYIQHIGDLIGALAATLTTTAFIPQAWHTWKTKHAKGISLGMYSTFTTGVALWLAYGLMIVSWPLIIANGITFVLALFILGMKIRFG
jgi:MtN3 and saliva related transmembrane protein